MNSIGRLPQNYCMRRARSISASPRLSNLRVKNKKSGGTKCETWRAASANAAFGDAANAYSYETTFADTGDGTPRLMRGAVSEAIDEDGVKTTNSYSLNGNVLVCETRKFCGVGESQFPTYETTETDATEGTILRRTTRLTNGGAIIADERTRLPRPSRPCRPLRPFLRSATPTAALTIRSRLMLAEPRLSLAYPRSDRRARRCEPVCFLWEQYYNPD